MRVERRQEVRGDRSYEKHENTKEIFKERRALTVDIERLRIEEGLSLEQFAFIDHLFL